MVTINIAVLLTSMCRPSTIQSKDTVAVPMVMLHVLLTVNAGLSSSHGAKIYTNIYLKFMLIIRNMKSSQKKMLNIQPSEM
jgi:hypothetical protein